MRHSDWRSFLTGEALVLSLLGKLLYAYPDRAWLRSLITERVFEDFPLETEQPDIIAGLGLLETWTHNNRSDFSNEAFEEVKADYTRLFIGLSDVLAPPWESVYLSREHLLFQEQTLQVRTWYARFGLEAEKLHSEPDDHIGLELSFLAHLAKLSLDGLDQKDGESFKRLIDAQRDFLLEHPLKWVPAWCRLVQEHGQTDLYRGAALASQGMLVDVASVLGIKAAEEA